MKIAAAIVGTFIFVWWGVPFLFHAMKKHDYDNLYHGMQAARVNGGAFHEEHKVYTTYTDRYMRGEIPRNGEIPKTRR